MRRRIPKTKIKNLTAKIGSLIVAVLLWTYVMGVENPNETRVFRNIKVTYQNLDAIEKKGLQLMNTSDQFVDVRVSGKKNDLQRLTQDSILATVDLEGYGEGEARIPIIPIVRGSFDITVESVTPPDLVYNFDAIRTREFEVAILTDGKPTENFVLGEPTTSTPKVTISGPSSELTRVKRVETRVNVEGKQASFTVSNPVYPVDENGKRVTSLTFQPTSIDVSIPVFKVSTVPLELVTTGALPDGYELTKVQLSPPTVALKALPEAKAPTVIKTEPVELETMINEKERKLSFPVPDGFSLLNPEQPYVLKYVVEKLELKEFEIAASQIRIFGLPEGLTIEGQDLPKTWKIVLRGYESSFEKIKIEDLRFDANAQYTSLGDNKLILELRSGQYPDVKIVEGKEMPVKVVQLENPAPEENKNDGR